MSKKAICDIKNKFKDRKMFVWELDLEPELEPKPYSDLRLHKAERNIYGSATLEGKIRTCIVSSKISFVRCYSCYDVLLLVRCFDARKPDLVGTGQVLRPGINTFVSSYCIILRAGKPIVFCESDIR